MTRFKFTDLKITQDAPKMRTKSGKSQLDIWDTIIAGLGGKVGATGTTFFARARGPNGKEKRISIGRHGGALTVAKARIEADRLIDDIKSGVDARPAPNSRRLTVTLRAALDLFCKTATAHSIKDYQSRITNHLSDWLDYDLAAITESMIETRFDELVADGKPDNANKVIKRFGTVYRRNRRKFHLPADPTTFMKEEKLYASVKKRVFPSNEMERDLSKIMSVIDGYANPILAAFGRLLALTGARPKQLRHLKWDDVDMSEMTFTMRNGSKTMDTATLPICPEARKVFVAMQKRRLMYKDERRDYVFPARDQRAKATPYLSEYKTLTAAIRVDLKWDFQMYDFRRWMASRSVSLMNAAEARHIQTHAATDAHGGYERPPASQLREPMSKFEKDFVGMAA